MIASVTALTVLAAEGVPPGTPIAVLAVPVGILAFVGSVFLLVRSNLGTRRGYLVVGASAFGFLFIMTMFWTFGAPGTPQATGPRNLPSQPANAYQPHWTPFHPESRLAQLPEYQPLVDAYPEGFGAVPDDFAAEAENGAGDTQSFFADAEHGEVVADVWEIETVEYAEAENSYAVIAVTFVEVDDQTFERVEGGEVATLFAFFDPGAPIFPGLLAIGLALLLFVLHAGLLFLDESRTNRERAELEEPATREPVPA